MLPPEGTFKRGRSRSSIAQHEDPDRKRRRNLQLSGHPETLRLPPHPTGHFTGAGRSTCSPAVKNRIHTHRTANRETRHAGGRPKDMMEL